MRQLLAPLAALAACAAPLAALDEADLIDETTKQFVIHYAIEKPANLENRHVGLFICFHGRGGKAPDEARDVLASLGRLGIADDYVVIGAKSVSDGWEESETQNFQNVTKLIEWATKAFPIDPRRRYCWGFSSGGWMSGAYTITHPDLIACAVVHGAGVAENKIAEIKDAARTQPDFYGICGTKDPDHLEAGRKGALKLQKCGYRSILREVEDLPHSTNCPEFNDDAALWAVSHRHKTAALPAYDVDALKPLRKQALKDLTADAKVFAGIALVGGPQTGALLTPALDAKDAAVRAMAAGTWEKAMYGVDAAAALVRKLKDKEPSVRAATLGALRTMANWRYAPAQEALEQVVADRRWNAEERLLAVDGLAFAVRLQVRGRYEDPAMFRALVVALDDDDQHIREHAFHAIERCAASNYDPAVPGRAERKSMLGKWQEWLATIEPKADDVAKRAAGAGK